MTDIQRDSIGDHAPPQHEGRRRRKKKTRHSATRPHTTSVTPPPPSAAPSPVAEGAMDPHRLASLFIVRNWHATSKSPLVRYWRQDWWQWREGRYRRVTDDEMKGVVTKHVKGVVDSQHVVNSNDKLVPVRPGDVNAVLNALQSLVSVDSEVEMPAWLLGGEERKYLAFKNGLMAIREGQPMGPLEPLSPQWFSPAVFPLDYDPLAEAPQWKKFLKQVLENDKERIALLQEWFGYCLVFDTSLHKFMILEGSGANGKSVVLKVLVALLGEKNVSHVQLEQFGDRFALSQTLGKLANINAEVSSPTSVAEGRLKEFVAGDRMTFERKGRDHFEAKPTARVVLATNHLPPFRDTTDGVWRRLIYVPFRVTISANEQDPKLPEKLIDELRGIYNWALQGLRRLRLNEGVFTQPAICREAKDRYRATCDSAGAFVRAVCAPGTGEQVFKDDLYTRYKQWCEEHQLPVQGDATLGTALTKAFSSVQTKREGGGARRRYYAGLRVLPVPEQPEAAASRASMPPVSSSNSNNESVSSSGRVRTPWTPWTAKDFLLAEDIELILDPATYPEMGEDEEYDDISFADEELVN